MSEIDMKEDMLYENAEIIEVGGEVRGASIRDESKVDLDLKAEITEKITEN